MSYCDSNLSNPYRCDFVFAVTQGAINAAMMNYLSDSPFPPVTCVWVMSKDAHPVPVQIPYAQLMELAQNSDPFKVPDGIDPDANQDVKNLVGARFLGGFRAQIGLPSGLDESTNVVTLGADTTSVQFNLLCSSFDVVQYTPAGEYTPASWMNKAQGQTPWIFQTRVNLRLAKFEGDDSQLPVVVRDRIESLKLEAGNFSIQQLFLQLDNPGGATVPSIIGVPNPSMPHDWLQEYFLGAYWDTMVAAKQPVLTHAIVAQPDDSSLALTSLKFQDSPYIPGPPPKFAGDLDTLCYLGETSNNSLPVTTGAFPWNWIDSTEESSWHGAVAINEASVKVWFKQALLPYVKSQCLTFKPHCEYDENVTKVFMWALPKNGMDPTTSTAGPNQLAYFTYVVSEDSQAPHSEITGKEHFSLEVVKTSDTQIKIVQKIVLYLYVYIWGGYTDGNFIDSEISSVYDMSVDAEGSVRFKLNESLSTRKDNPYSLDFHAFADWLYDSPNEKVIDPITKVIQSRLESLGDPDLSTARFIIPGHSSVAYSGAKFAPSGDLVFHLTYGTPK